MPLPFHLLRPADRSSSVIFASPHSGCDYPAEFLRETVLDNLTIRSSEDAFVDQLFADVPMFGASLLCAKTPRSYVDLNRGCDELDPALIEGAHRPVYNPRMTSGLGVIPRVVAGGRAIYGAKLSMDQAKARLMAHWHPYHAALQGLIEQNQQDFGEAILIDCHSMPHAAMDGPSKPNSPRAEIVLGDRFGAAADADIVDQIEAAFMRAGLHVARNAPFAGAYVSQHYGRPKQGQHVVQIEIDRSLYMNEQTVRPNDCFAEFKRLIGKVSQDIVQIGRRVLPLAAE